MAYWVCNGHQGGRLPGMTLETHTLPPWSSEVSLPSALCNSTLALAPAISRGSNWFAATRKAGMRIDQMGSSHALRGDAQLKRCSSRRLCKKRRSQEATWEMRRPTPQRLERRLNSIVFDLSSISRELPCRTILSGRHAKSAWAAPPLQLRPSFTATWHAPYRTH